MTSTTSPAPAATVIVAIAPSADLPGRLDVIAGETRVGSVKDGGHIVANAERVLRANGYLRSTGYDLDADRRLVATAYSIALPGKA